MTEAAAPGAGVRPLESIGDDAFRKEHVFAYGWSLQMLALRLPGGDLVVYSPLWRGDETFDELDRVGRVRWLIAPNHFHHLSLGRFRARYPEARALASAGARPRLVRKGHDGLGDLDELAPHLPSGSRTLACAGVKNGETWMTWPTPAGPALVVCDAFFNVARTTGAAGWILRRLGVVGELCFGGTFKVLAVADRARFRDWALETLAAERPQALWPSHGALASGEDLGHRLAETLRRRLPVPGG